MQGLKQIFTFLNVPIFDKPYKFIVKLSPSYENGIQGYSALWLGRLCITGTHYKAIIWHELFEHYTRLYGIKYTGPLTTSPSVFIVGHNELDSMAMVFPYEYDKLCTFIETYFDIDHCRIINLKEKYSIENLIKGGILTYEEKKIDYDLDEEEADEKWDF